MTTNNNTDGKTAAIVAYLSILGTIIAFFINFYDRHKFSYFHIRQALGLNITLFIIGYFVGYFDSCLISGPFYLSFIMLWFYGFMVSPQHYQAQTNPYLYWENIIKNYFT